MKEFDLEQALAGAALITRDGREATEFRRIAGHKMLASRYPYEAKVGATHLSYLPSGRYWGSKHSEHDLFLAG